MKKHDIFDVELDDEEKAISAAIDKGKLKSIPNVAKQIARAQVAARNTLRKDERITLRISASDLERLKQKAAYKGLPYQTFVTSILHEYAAGHFVEVN
jgi:predicted DNA binding CopG/RHH family protein